MDDTVQVQILTAVVSDVRHAAIILLFAAIVPGILLRQSVLSSVAISVMLYLSYMLYMVSPTLSQVQK